MEALNARASVIACTERAATFPFSEVGVRHDGLLQAGPTPKSEKLGSPSSVISFLHELRERA